MQALRETTGAVRTLSSGKFADFARSETGETAIEYTLIVGLISFAILTALSTISTVMNDNVFAVIASAASSII
uniref:Flp family type IVb pilin n=1 Tax=Stappia sp. TaxID=1870903 RepID=UPI003BAD8873